MRGRTQREKKTKKPKKKKKKKKKAFPCAFLSSFAYGRFSAKKVLPSRRFSERGVRHAYDYVVVGSGPGACALVARLASHRIEGEPASILMLEVGRESEISFSFFFFLFFLLRFEDQMLRADALLLHFG